MKTNFIQMCKNILLVIIMAILAACSGGDNQPAKKSNHQMDQMAPTDVSRGQAVPGYAPVVIDPGRLQLMGITTTRIEPRRLVKTLRTVGILEAPETRISQVQTKFSGWIEDLYVDFLGKAVKRGQPLFTIYSPELLATQEEYLLAYRDAQRAVTGPYAEAARQGALDLANAARRRLELWDVPAGEIDRLAKTGHVKRTLTINSPLTGIVIQKNALKGMNVEPGMDLFVIADLSRIWVQADIYESDIAYIKPGQGAKLFIEALPERDFHGVVTFINPVLDVRTRTAKVRLEIDNRSQLLKPGMYATVKLELDRGSSLALPEEAVIDTGTRKIVFLMRVAGHFEPREVDLGSKAGRFYPVLAGLSEGDNVATSAQFLLDSESRIRAEARAPMEHH